jgi:hypothetical protein
VPEELPAVTLQPRMAQALACVYGLPPRTPVEMTVRGPAGEFFTRSFDTGPLQNLPADPPRTGTITGAFVNWPSEKTGEWGLDVTSGEFSQSMSLDRAAPNNRAWFANAPLGPGLHNGLDGLYKAGTTIQFTGGALPEGVEPNVGIYALEQTGELQYDYFLHTVIDAAFDADGNLRAEFTVPPDMEPGRYWAIPAYPEMETATFGVWHLISAGTEFEVLPAQPAPDLAAAHVAQVGRPVEITFQGLNTGSAATAGGSLSISSPDVEKLEIISADAPIAPTLGPGVSTACSPRTSQATVLGPGTPCQDVWRFTANCRGMVKIREPLAELWQRPWDAASAHEVTVRAWPKPGVTALRFHARTALRQNGSGCLNIVAPPEGPVDQLGFPVQEIIVRLPPE